MEELVYDVETNGFIDELTKIHCLVIINVETGESTRYNDQNNGHPSIEEGVRRLQNARVIRWGHNIIDFDERAIKKVYPWYEPKGVIRDSLVISRLIWTNLKEKDFTFVKKNPKFPMYLVGRHSLEAWGARLGCPKDDYAKRCKERGIDPWAEWNQDMEDYCEQDVRTNLKFIQLIKSKNYSEEAIELEQDVWKIILRQQAYGFRFNKKKATELYALLVGRKEELTTELQKVFKPFYVRNGKTVYPKKTMKRQGVEYTENTPYCKVKLIDFNPNSRDQIANRLVVLRGWKPKQLTDKGKPEVNEATIGGLPYPEIPLLLEFLMIAKRIGQIAEGQEAWLKHEKNGRMHGRVDTNGAVTGRMTHSKPNMAQVPASYSPYGKECRDLFEADEGKELLGFDADALEARCLAGYMAKWDDGEYVKTVLEGNKTDGTDVHSRNMRAIRIESRDDSKTFFYAYMYGGGDYKLGTIIAESMKMKKLKKSQIVQLGKTARSRIEQGLPALGSLVKGVKAASKKKGWLKGLDGRRIICRSEHSALNTLLQSAGAVLMKKCLVLLDQALQAKGYKPGTDYEYCANVHDEFQLNVKPELAKEFGEEAKQALIRAGEHFKFGCPLAGSYAIGSSWLHTH